MGRWLELFRTLTNSDPLRMTDGDTPRHTDARANDRLYHDNYNGNNAPRVCHDVSPSVILRGPLKSASETLSDYRNGSGYPAASSSIETPATTLEPARVVFCDFETRNVGGCDLESRRLALRRRSGH